MKKQEIVRIHKNEPRTSTWILKDGFDSDHRAITKLIKKYKTEFEEFGIIASEVQKLNGAGRPAKAYLLNENQTYFLGTLLPNTDKVREFKRVLVKNFAAAKTALLQMSVQKQSATWLAQRQAGKLIRREQTDTIQEFVEYATVQGSTQAHRYYCNITKMENQALFLLEQKFKNLRDILDLNQLGLVRTADSIVKKALKDGMADGLYYKDIYRLAKSRIETLADIHGKTFIPASQIENHNRLMVEA